MSGVKGYPISADELALIEEIWKVVTKHRDKVKPAEAIAMLAQVIGAVIGAANIQWENEQQLSDLIELNIHAGLEAIERTLNETAGHA